MFVGHFAVGLAAKRVAPAVSLGTLVLAAMLADLLWCLAAIPPRARLENAVLPRD
jgi:hypothetical protein